MGAAIVVDELGLEDPTPGQGADQSCDLALERRVRRDRLRERAHPGVRRPHAPRTLVQRSDDFAVPSHAANRTKLTLDPRLEQPLISTQLVEEPA